MVQRARKTSLSCDVARVSAHSSNCRHEARATELVARENLSNLHAQLFGLPGLQRGEGPRKHAIIRYLQSLAIQGLSTGPTPSLPPG